VLKVDEDKNMASWDNIKDPLMMVVGGVALAIIISVLLIIYG